MLGSLGRGGLMTRNHGSCGEGLNAGGEGFLGIDDDVNFLSIVGARGTWG